MLDTLDILGEELGIADMSAYMLADFETEVTAMVDAINREK